MTPDFPFDQESSICPRCGKPVAWKWATGPRGGFVSEPHNALIADVVFHAECWDALVAEHPPGEADPAVDWLDLPAGF